MKIPPGKKVRAVKKAAARRPLLHHRKPVAKRPANENQTRAALEAYSTARQSSVYGDLRKVTLSLDDYTTDVLRRVGRGSMSEGARHLARLVNVASLQPTQSIDIPPPAPSPQVPLFQDPREAIEAGIAVLDKLIDPEVPAP